MKSILNITALALIFSLYNFAQDKNYRGVNSERMTAESLREIHKPNTNHLQELNEKDTWTTVNKTLLNNGYLLIEQIYQVWYSVWLNGHKYLFTYDGNNNQTEFLDQYWDVSAWMDDAKISSAYDTNNNITEEVYQSWDGSAWLNNTKFLYTFDGNNNQIELLIQSWNGFKWVDGVKYSYTYDGNNNQTEFLYQIWDGSVWVNNYKYSYIYDGNNNQTENLWQTWNGSTWVNYTKYSYTYDGNNNQTENHQQYWNGSAWMNIDKYSYTYDGNNNQTESLLQNWNGSAWMNYSKTSYTYVPITEVNGNFNSVNSYGLSYDYPNPFNPSTSISYSLPRTSFVRLIIYNILGQEVTTLINEEKSAGKYELNWNAENLPSGVYFYKLQAGGFVQTRKMILLK